MTALSADIKATEWGVPNQDLMTRGMQASTTIYRGSVAVANGPGGSHVGYLRNPATPTANDIVIGIVDDGVGVPNTSPGITSPSGADGQVHVNIRTGTFILASGTSADALGVTTNGTTVYLIDEKTVGATSGSSTRPVAGVQMACNVDDPSIPTGFVAVKLGTPNSPLGGP